MSMYRNVEPLLATYIEINPFLRSVKRVVSRIPPPPIHSGSSSGKRREDQTSPARTEGGEIFTVEVAAEGGVGGENHERTAGGRGDFLDLDGFGVVGRSLVS